MRSIDLTLTLTLTLTLAPPLTLTLTLALTLTQVTRSIDVWDSRTQYVVGSGVDKVQRWQHSALSCRDEVWPH